MTPSPSVTIIGGGLAGCEAAWQAASRGVRVRLHEMRPVRRTAVHQTDALAELVCSNSFRGDKLDNAVGLLKEEMRRLGSLVMRVRRARPACRPERRSPSTARRFAAAVTDAHHVTSAHHASTRDEVTTIPAPAADGPGHHRDRPADLGCAVGRPSSRFVGAEHLSFYDAISPIVLADSIDHGVVFRASRWGRNCARARRRRRRYRTTHRPAVRVRRGRRAGRLPELPARRGAVPRVPRGTDRPPSRPPSTTSTRRSSSKAACRSR